MTDRFVCPEPSEAAVIASARGHFFEHDRAAGLRAAYAVDVPALVKQEVERALRELADYIRVERPTILEDWWPRYAAMRFPEAAPEIPQPKMGETLHTCTLGPDCPNHRTFVAPTPSAPAHNLCGKHLLEDCPTCRAAFASITPSAPVECQHEWHHPFLSGPASCRKCNHFQQPPGARPEAPKNMLHPMTSAEREFVRELAKRQAQSNRLSVNDPLVKAAERVNAEAANGK